MSYKITQNWFKSFGGNLGNIDLRGKWFKGGRVRFRGTAPTTKNNTTYSPSANTWHEGPVSTASGTFTNAPSGDGELISRNIRMILTASSGMFNCYLRENNWMGKRIGQDRIEATSANYNNNYDGSVYYDIWTSPGSSVYGKRRMSATYQETLNTSNIVLTVGNSTINRSAALAQGSISSHNWSGLNDDALTPLHLAVGGNGSVELDWYIDYVELPKVVTSDEVTHITPDHGRVKGSVNSTGNNALDVYFEYADDVGKFTPENSNWTDWVFGTTYAKGQIVKFGVDYWQCVQSHTTDQNNQPPHGEFWESYSHMRTGTIKVASNAVTPAELTADLAGLKGDHEYFFRIVAVATDGHLPQELRRVEGAIESFTTKIGPPWVETLAFSDLTIDSSRLRGRVSNTGGLDPEIRFEYGLTPAFGTIVNPTNLPGGVGGAGFYFYDLTDLDVDTKYYYRFYADNSGGPKEGGDRSNGITRDFTTLYPYLPPPEVDDPEPFYRTVDPSITFIFSLEESADNTAKCAEKSITPKYHARLRVGRSVEMENAEYVLETIDNRDNWWYHDGSDWLAFPEAGVDPGTTVRYISDEIFTPGVYYWDCTARDNYNHDDTPTGRYGINLLPYQRFSVVVRIEDVYFMSINGEPYNVFNMHITETSNGQIGSVKFDITNQGFENALKVKHGDTVMLGIVDINGYREDFMGRVRNKTPHGTFLTVDAIMGDGILAERKCTKNYPDQADGIEAIIEEGEVVKNILTENQSSIEHSNDGFTATDAVAERSAEESWDDDHSLKIWSADVATEPGEEIVKVFDEPGAFEWEVPEGLYGGTVEIIMVGGGGPAGRNGTNVNRNGGAGGAGGLIHIPAYTISDPAGTKLNGVVGAGGKAVNSATENGPNGEDTTFEGLTAVGGGYGGTRGLANDPNDGGDGGSGGGGSSFDSAHGNGGASTQPSTNDGYEDSGFGNDGATSTGTGGHGGGAGGTPDGKIIHGETYAKGGLANSTGQAGRNGFGDGGHCRANDSNAIGGDGGHGRVEIRYRLNVAGDPTPAEKDLEVKLDPVSVFPNVTLTASTYLFGEGTVRLVLAEYSGDHLVDTAVGTVLTLNDTDWQRATVSKTFGSTGNNAVVIIETDEAQEITFYADGLQLEENPTVTDWQLGGLVNTVRVTAGSHGLVQGDKIQLFGSEEAQYDGYYDIMFVDTDTVEVKADYDEDDAGYIVKIQDVGISIKDMIDTYCAPLTSIGVKTDTGFVAPVIAKDRTVLSVMESLRRAYGLYYYTDSDWDVHLYQEDDIDDDPDYSISRGSIPTTYNMFPENIANFHTDGMLMFPVNGEVYTDDYFIGPQCVRLWYEESGFTYAKLLFFKELSPVSAHYTISVYVKELGYPQWTRDVTFYLHCRATYTLQGVAPLTAGFDIVRQLPVITSDGEGGDGWFRIELPVSIDANFPYSEGLGIGPFNRKDNPLLYVTIGHIELMTTNFDSPPDFLIDGWQLEEGRKATPFTLPGDYRETSLMISEPSINMDQVVATHITVKSPTHSYQVSLPDVKDEERIDKVFVLDGGNEEMCKEVAEAMLEKYGREQFSVTARVDLNLAFKFKQLLRFIFNYTMLWLKNKLVSLAKVFSLSESWRLDEPSGWWFWSDFLDEPDSGGPVEDLILQRKSHGLADYSTEVQAGDIQLDDAEMIARILEEFERRKTDV